MFERLSEDTLSIEKPGINKIGESFFASIDGHSGVPVDKDLAENISFALKVQNKVDKAIKTGNNPNFLKIVAMLNCRQTIFVMKNITSVKSLVENKNKLEHEEHSPMEKIDLIERMTGVQEMRDDINRILNSGRLPVVGSQEDMQIRDYFETHPDDFPCVVHIFSIETEHIDEIKSKSVSNHRFEEYEDNLIRSHTFIVLGKSPDGKYICFHKQGPEIQDKFELSELESVLDSAVVPVSSNMYLSFIGPAKI